MQRRLIILYRRFQVDLPGPTSAGRGAYPRPNVPAAIQRAVKLDSLAACGPSVGPSTRGDLRKLRMLTGGLPIWQAPCFWPAVSSWQ